MPRTDAEKNDMMGRVAPELLSPYAAYPLTQTSSFESWLDAKSTGPDSAPGFFPNGGSTTIKEHYVYGAGSKGMGHYHLLTRDSYVILAARLLNNAPIGWCCFADSRRAADEHFEVRQICYNRSVSSVPNDVIAAQQAVVIASATVSGEEYY